MLEQVTKGKLLEKVKAMFDDAIVADTKWQQSAQEAFKFRNNIQWDEDEVAILEQERRPALTLNVIKSHVDLIMGLNEDLKKRFTCSPVSPDDSFLCEVINNVMYWLYQRYDWESEEDHAFESAIISGRGWVAIDFDIDENKLEEIKITESSIPVHEVRMDPATRKRDLTDASYICWERWYGLEDFCVKYPKHQKMAVQAFRDGTWPRSEDFLMEISNMGHDINDESDYSDPLNVNYYDSKKQQIRVCHMEYWKYVTKYFYFDPATGKWLPVQGTWNDFKKQWAKSYPNEELRYESTIQKELWWIQFCGDDILVHAKSPIDYPGFSIVPCFLYSDVSRKSNNHFGIVDLMKDPQREINKRTSQTLNLFNQQVQPGLYAETRAFVDANQAEQSLKEAGSITWLADGALSQGRLQERTVPQFPAAVLQMGEYSREMLRHITGINPDLLGMNDKRREAGIVVQLRQQQGMAILKPVFRAYQDMKKALFERQVRIIMAHMPANQIAKILGEKDRYQVSDGVITDTKTGLSCDLRNISDIAYDIDAEPETNSMTHNALEMATFMELQQAGIPVDPKVIIGKTNLPVTEKLGWIQYIEDQQKGASEQAQAEMELEKMKIELQHQREMAKIESGNAIAIRKIEDAREKDILKGSVDQEKLRIQEQRDNQTAQIKMIQVISQAQLGSEEAKRKAIDMMLDADIDRKRLILDTMEVMANAGMAGQELKVKAAVDMYKAALDSSTTERIEEEKLAVKMFEAMLKVKTEMKKVEGGNKNAKAGQQTKDG